MSSKSFWIWHFGDYEIYHTMNVHLKREERGVKRPPFWKIQAPYISVKFRKRIKSEGGYLICHINGEGYVDIDYQKRKYASGERIELSPGEHKIDVFVMNRDAFPAIFVESDVCPSDGSWICTHFAGSFNRVASNPYFDSLEKNPARFPFEYERALPVSSEKIGNGILYDFGTELFGYLDIKNVNPDDKIGAFYGESREEALDTDYSYITDEIFGKDEYRLTQRAFRYIYLTNVGDDVGLSADFEHLPLSEKGSFECDNALFNDILSAAKYTFLLNCREGFFDGIKRDRWLWSGDAYQSARINRYLFADEEIEQRTLIGLIGRLPIEQHVNTILDYSFLWIIMLYEHYMTYGDKVFLSRIYPMAQALLEFCETRINSDGFVEGIDFDWTFIDWSEIEKTGAVCAEQMLLIQAYKCMSFIASELELSENADIFLEKSKNLTRLVNEFYWNEEKGAFIDSYASGNNNVTRHANIFAITYDIADENQQKSILEKVLNNDNIRKITTPYFEGYELDALAKLGEFGKVENMISSYWGGMLKLGAKTIWEEYDPNVNGIEHYAMYGGKYEKSLCHAWGAGPIYLFGRYYLGVCATKPGYESFTVEPHFGGLKEFSGVVPINGGEVFVELNEKRLLVKATKLGGTLIWKNKEYELKPNEALILEGVCQHSRKSI